MRQLIVTTVLLVLAGGPAVAQTGSGTGSSSSGANSTAAPADNRPLREAPVGHRQPRASDVPSEKNLGNPNDPINREDAALDRRIKSICRGC